MNENDQYITDLVSVFREDYFLLYDFDLIFSTNKLQIDLLNETACNFFNRLSGLYSAHFFLKISQMLDPVEHNNHKNFSLYGLLGLAKKNQDHDQLKKKIDAIKGEVDAGKIKQVRNKYIAHRDINYKNISNTSVEFEKIKQLYDRIGDCINDVLESLGKQKEIWSVFIPDNRYGAMALLECLKESMIYLEIKINRKDTIATHNEAKKTKYGELQFKSSIWKS